MGDMFCWTGFGEGICEGCVCLLYCDGIVESCLDIFPGVLFYMDDGGGCCRGDGDAGHDDVCGRGVDGGGV